MRLTTMMAALMAALQDGRSLSKVYLIGQDYSFGRQISRQARVMVTARRPDIRSVGASCTRSPGSTTFCPTRPRSWPAARRW
jgi:hypothetical protein